ncbi:hypothetical protein BX600DRAFT_555738 [Xylariales sp. PMI_506]|nr:hypothetical protein BX600DRAFT_555738 [Xylariales sp. PMI_506]
MSIPEAQDILSVPVYSAENEQAVQEISWSQTLRTKTAHYFIVKAKNVSKGNADVLLYIQDRFYKDSNSPDFIGKLPGAKEENGNWIVKIDDHFQYGQKNQSGENRWVCLHDKGNKPFQHRFMVTTIQGNAAEWAKKLAGSFGASELADNVSKLGSSFVGDYLKTF